MALPKWRACRAEFTKSAAEMYWSTAEKPGMVGTKLRMANACSWSASSTLGMTRRWTCISKTITKCCAFSYFLGAMIVVLLPTCTAWCVDGVFYLPALFSLCASLTTTLLEFTPFSLILYASNTVSIIMIEQIKSSKQCC